MFGWIHIPTTIIYNLTKSYGIQPIPEANSWLLELGGTPSLSALHYYPFYMLKISLHTFSNIPGYFTGLLKNSIYLLLQVLRPSKILLRSTVYMYN